MALKSDIRDLPKVVHTTTWPAVFGEAIVEYLEHRRQEDSAEHVSSGSKIKASQAARCSRRVAFNMAGYKEPPNRTSSLWTFAMGDAAHEIVQAAFSHQFGTAAAHEVVVSEGVRHGRADTLFSFPEPLHLVLEDRTVSVSKVLVETKSTGGFNFKNQVLKDGPKPEAYLQGAMNAHDAGADLLLLVYVSKDLQVAAAAQAYGAAAHDIDSFYATWVYTPAEFEPDAAAEIARLTDVAALVEQGVHPCAIPATVPGLPAGALITDPSRSIWQVLDDTGATVDSGSLWRGKFCSYCPFQEECLGGLPQT